MFSLIIVIIFILVGVLISLKYRKVKDKTYIWWGIGVLGQGLPWLGSGVSFLMIVQTGEGLSPGTYFFLMTFWMAITLFFWMWTMTELMVKEKQKIILVIYAVIGISFDAYLIFYLITDPSVIGTLSTPPIDSTYIGISRIFTLFVIASISVSLFIFIGKSLKTENPEVKLKSKILLVAMITSIFGSFVDAFISLTTAPIFIIRIILISAAIEFYIGWILPEFVKKRLLKKE